MRYLHWPRRPSRRPGTTEARRRASRRCRSEASCRPCEGECGRGSEGAEDGRCCRGVPTRREAADPQHIVCPRGAAAARQTVWPRWLHVCATLQVWRCEWRRCRWPRAGRAAAVPAAAVGAAARARLVMLRPGRGTVNPIMACQGAVARLVVGLAMGWNAGARSCYTAQRRGGRAAAP